MSCTNAERVTHKTEEKNEKKPILLLTYLLSLSILCGCGQQQVSQEPSNQASTSSSNGIVEIGQIIYNKDGFIISIQSIEKKGDYYLFRFNMQNKSKHDITDSSCHDVYIDDYGIPASHGSTVNPVKGKTGYSEIYFHDNYFQDIGLDFQSAKAVEGVFTIHLDNDWSKSIDIPFSVNLSELFTQSNVAPVTFDGRVLYNEGNIKVGVQKIEKSDSYYLLILRIENMSGYDITSTICSDSYIDDYGVAASHGSSSDPAQGKTGFVYLYFHKDSIEKAGLSFDKIKIIEGIFKMYLGEGYSNKIEIPFKLQLKDFNIVTN